jgi:O-antigen/teichoic acid export membrane protein
MLFRNTLAQSSSRIVGYVASFVLAPLMLSRLGLASFGVWAVTGAVATYVYLLDFGMTRSLSRFIALYDASEDPKRLRECVGLGLAVVSGVGLLGLPAAALAAPWVADVLGELSASEMRVVLMSTIALATCQAYGSVLASIPIGLRQMVPPSVAFTVNTLINFTFSVSALAVSSELTDYAVANALAGLVGLVPPYLSMRRVWSGPFAALPSRSLIHEVTRYGVKAQVNWLADLVNLQTDKIVIAVMLGVRTAGAFEVGSRVALAVRSLGLMTLSAMIPTATAHIVDRGREAIPAFYQRYLSYSVGVAFPLFVAASASGPFLLVAWLGDVPDDTVETLVLLTAATYVNVTTGVAMTVAMAEGEAGIVARYSAVLALLNVALTVALAPLFGLWGVLGGTVVGWSIGSLLFVWRFGEVHDIPFTVFLRAVLPAAFLSLALALPFVAWYAAGGTVPDDRLPAAVWGGAIVGVYGLAYVLIASRQGLIPKRLRLPRVKSEAVRSESEAVRRESEAVRSGTR